MQLTREAIQRMINGTGGGSIGGSGGSDINLAGYATEAWVEEGYISKTWWASLFVVHLKQQVVVVDENNQEISNTTTYIVVSPNEIPESSVVTDETTGYTTTTTITVDQLEVIPNLWSRGAVSALGYNNSGGGGGGGGGADLADVWESLTTNSSTGSYAAYYNVKINKGHIPNIFDSLANANNQLSITINGQNRKLTVAFATEATYATRLRSIDMASGDDYDTLSGYTKDRGSFVATNWLTSANGFNGITLADKGLYDTLVSFGYGNRTIQFKGSGFSDVLKYRHVEGTINNYSLSAWKTIAFTDSTVAQANRLSGNDTKTAWGRTYWSSGVPQNVSGSIDFGKNDFIRLKENDTTYNLFGFNGSDNTLLIGWGLNDLDNSKVTIASGTILSIGVGDNPADTLYGGKFWSVFHENGHLTINALDDNDTSRNIFLNVGGAVRASRLYLFKNNSDIYLEYDATNGGIHLVGGGLYADTYISALGLNNSGSGIQLKEPLASINSAGLGVPTGTDKVLLWTGSAWTYGAINKGSVTEVRTGTGLTGGPITSSGEISISSTYQNYISHGEQAYNSLGNYATLASVTTLQSYFTNGVANQAVRLSGNNSYTAWGQTYWSGGKPQSISGNIENTGGITPSASNTYSIGTRNNWYKDLFINYLNIIDGPSGVGNDFNIRFWDVDNKRVVAMYGWEEISGVGTPTDIIIGTTSSNLALYFDSANWRVGIHNGSPQYELDVVGTAKATTLRANDIYIGGIHITAQNNGIHINSAGLYADTYVSALGLNDSSGGVTLCPVLESINSTDGLGAHPQQPNQTIIWNGSNWTFGTTGVDMSEIWNSLTSNSSTDAGYNKKINAAHLPDIFTLLTNDNNQLSITINSQNRKLIVAFATESTYASRLRSIEMADGDNYDSLSQYTATRSSFVAARNAGSIEGRGITLDGANQAGYYYPTLVSFGYGNRTIQFMGFAWTDVLKYRHVQGTNPNYSLSAWKTIAFTDSTVAQANRLSGNDTKTAWGRTYWSSGVPQNVSGNIEFSKEDYIQLKDSGSTYNLFGYASDNTLLIGWGLLNKSGSSVTITADNVLNIGVGNNSAAAYSKYWSIFRANGHLTINANDESDIFLNVGGAAKATILHANEIYIGGIRIKADNGGIHIVGNGLYADKYISALGLNNSSSGLTLCDALQGINNAGLAATPSQDGQAIVWKGNKWVYGTTGVDMATIWTKLGASTTEQIAASHLTTALNGYLKSATANTLYVTALGTNGNYLTWTKNGSTNNITVPYATVTPNIQKTTISDLKAFINSTYFIYSAMGGGNSVADKPSYGGSVIDSFGVLSFKIADGYQGQILITAYGGGTAYIRGRQITSGAMAEGGWKQLAAITDNVSSSTKLATARKLWNQSFDGTADVSGDMEGVGHVNATDSYVITKTGATSGLQINGSTVNNTSYRRMISLRLDDKKGEFGLVFRGDNGSQKNVLWLSGGTSSNNYVYTASMNATLSISQSDTIPARVTVSNSAGQAELMAAESIRGLYDRTNSRWLLGTTGSMSFLMGGTVGVGTTSPDTNYKMQVEGRLYVNSGSNGNSLVINSTGTYSVLNYNLGGTFQWSAGADDTNFYFYGGNAIRMVISKAAGNVGIGVTTPTSKLHVNGSVRIGNAILTWNDTDKVLGLIHATTGQAASFYATGAVSALGQNTSSSGGSGSVVSLEVIKNYLQNPAGDAVTIDSSFLTDYAKTSAAKNLTIQVNGTNLYQYSPFGTTARTLNFKGDSGITVSGSSSSIVTIKLTNSSLTVNGSSVSLGGTVTTATWGTSRNFTIKSSDGSTAGTAAAVDGSGAVTLLLPATIKASITGNASTATSATKLADTTAHTVWGATYWQNGQPKSVTEADLTLPNGKGIKVTNTNTNSDYALYLESGSSTSLIVGRGMGESGNFASVSTYLRGRQVIIQANNNGTKQNALVAYYNGNVGIGTSDVPSYKLQVAGILNVSAGGILLNNNISIRANDQGGTGQTILGLNSSNVLHLGDNTARAGMESDIFGSPIVFNAGTSATSSTPVKIMTVSTTGLKIESGKVLEIGGGRLVWDPGNNAIKITNANGTAVNLYAMGAVSALGFAGTGVQTAIDSLTVSTGVKFKDYANSEKVALSVTKAQAADGTNILRIGEGWNTVYHDTRIRGFNVGIETGNESNLAVSVNAEGKTTFNYLATFLGYLKSTRYYLSDNVYIAYNNSQLQLHIGSNTYNLTKTAA